MTEMWILLGALTCSIGTQLAMGSEINIESNYKGSVSRERGWLKIATPSTGLCQDFPQICDGLEGGVSFLFPWSGNERGGTTGTKKILISPSGDRDNFYIGWKDSSNITLTNERGESHQLKLLYPYLSYGVSPVSKGSNDEPLDVEDLMLASGNIESGDVNAVTPRGFALGDYAWSGNGFSYNSVPFRQGKGKTEVNLGYIGLKLSIEAPDISTWSPGTYTGKDTFKFGKDIDFGNNFQGNADDVNINFTVKVEPDMYVKFWTGQGSVVNADLQPPGGWLNWNDRMPPNLSKEITFDFGSTAAVKMHLTCDHTVGKSCGIVDQQGGDVLGVDTFLSANHLLDDAGKPARLSPLSTEERVFKPDTPGGTGVQPAQLLFKTQDGVTQKMQRGHQYSGIVHVVFDSDVTP
ncbi:hypothetical protein [Burkholderia pyrrocinia]